jgi:histidinol-phosphate aminotransferase
LYRVKDSFNSYPIDRLSQKAGIAAFGSDIYYRDIQKRIIRTREESIVKLKGLGFRVLDTASNFIFASHTDRDAGEIYKKLKERKVLVRYFKKSPVDGYVRITVGTDKQMEVLFTELEKIISGC